MTTRLGSSPADPRSSISGRAEHPPINAWAIVALFTVAGLLQFMYLYLDDVTRQRTGTLGMRLVEEATGAYAALVLFPGLLWLERRTPLTAGRWRQSWLPHVCGLLVYSATHTTLLATSRRLIVPAVGMGSYDYGLMQWRYVMEFPSDVVTYLTLLGILSFLRVQRDLRDRDRVAAEAERSAVEAQLEMLSARLQPHFLFNALNTISSTLYTDPVAADTMISALGDLLRHSLRTSGRQEITVAEEIAVLKAYLSIIESRFGDRLRSELAIDPAALDLAVPALLLQPLVENAVQHGSASEQGESHIVVRVSRLAASLEIVIENDLARTMPAERAVGTGLHTTKHRLSLLYGERHQFRTDASSGRFVVDIRIPARVLVPTGADGAEQAPDHLLTDARPHR